MTVSTEYRSYAPVSECWIAIDRDTYEPGCAMGSGSTESAAIFDLYDQLSIEHFNGSTIGDLSEAVERAYTRAFPRVEDSSDLQAMEDGLQVERDRGNG